jgi:soluble epoxide hydrolase/lipid-phosphate phosphatase
MLNSISAEYVDINPKAKRTLLFLHGWPSLWASWKYQIQEFRVGGVLLFDDIRHFVMRLACRRITV